MAMWLRQSTASQEILLGRFVDSTDGDTEETALTINNTDIKLHKHGATTLASKNSGGGTHISNGLYYAVLDATDTDTLGNLEVHVHVSGALAVKREYVVLPAMIFDSLVLGTDRFDVNVTHIADTSQTARDIGASVLLSSGTGTGQVKLSSGYVAPNWGDVGNPTTTVNLSGTSTKALEPTVPGRTLDVSAGGEAGVDWANVGTPGSTVNLSATTIATLTNAPSDSSGVTTLLTRIGGTITITAGRVNADVTHIATAAVDTSSAQLGVNVVNAAGTAWGSGAITAASIATDAITAAKIAADAIGASELASDAVTEIVTGVLTTAMTESYSTDGSTATVAQALYLIMQALTESSISSTTWTIKKLDGTTTAATLTLNSSSAPTSVTRSG